MQYLSDTPDGAWAEFLRHEEITDEEDLAGVSRALWAVAVPSVPDVAPDLDRATMTGGLDTYPSCQAEARRLRAAGVTEVVAPSAALRPGGAGGWTVDEGLRPGARRDGKVLVLFGRRPDLAGWCAVSDGRPPSGLLDVVQPL